MNLIKRATVWLLALVMVLGMIPQTAFAEEKAASPLKYEIEQNVNEDKTEATISFKITETEKIQLEKVTLPDGKEKTEDLTVITYSISENGKYDFKVDYSVDGAGQEQTIPVEVTELEGKKTEEKEQSASDELKSNKMKVNGNTYEVSTSDEFNNALEQIKNNQDTEATIILTANIGNNTNFVGVTDKSITVKSTEGQKYALSLGSELVGNITLDNVKVTAGTLYCSGHRTIFTENCDFTISGTLYGGGNKKTVESVYVKINGTGKINTADRENVVVGGSYKGSVNGDIYVELAGNISYGNEEGGNYLIGTNKATAYGGDSSQKDLYVGGDVTLILDSPIKDTKPQNVVGAYNSHVKGNVTVQVKSGYTVGIEGMREDPKQSIVDGDIHIIAGDPAYAGTDRTCRIGGNWDIVGAGEKINLTGSLFQVGGNVTIDTYENVWGWNKGDALESDPPGIVGAESASVEGNVTINANGSHLEDIIGVDDSATTGSVVNGDIVINATDIDLRNKFNSKSGIIPVYATAGKDVTVNLDGGSLSGIYGYGGTVVGNMDINITGKPVFTDDEAGVWGVNNTDTKERSVLNFDKAETSIPIVGYFTEMNVTNDSDVILGNENKNAFGTVYDININSNAKLTTNKQAYSKGTLTMDHGTWVANGFLYVTATTNTKNSNIVMNDYAAFGYGHKDDTAYSNTVVTSNNDTYTFNKNDYTDKIYGNAEITGSTWSVFVPTIIGGNYNATTSKLNLLAFTGDENYPDKKIPLEILGIAKGSTAVTLVDKNDTSKEGKPIVGQNYINALKTSEKTFELANENAKPEGLYFKKLADANTEDKAEYDMWQVAKKDAYQVLYAFESGTSDKTLPNEVTSLLPKDSAKYFEGDTVTAIQPEKTEIAVSGGVWKFKGYDADSKVASDDHVNDEGYIQFTGTWEFELNTNVPDKPDDGGDKPKPDKPEQNKPEQNQQENAGKGTVKTADEANTMEYVLLMLVSALFIGILMQRRKVRS